MSDPPVPSSPLDLASLVSSAADITSPPSPQARPEASGDPFEQATAPPPADEEAPPAAPTPGGGVSSMEAFFADVATVKSILGDVRKKLVKLNKLSDESKDGDADGDDEAVQGRDERRDRGGIYHRARVQASTGEPGPGQRGGGEGRRRGPGLEPGTKPGRQSRRR